MLQSTFLEAVHGAFSILYLCACYIFGHYIWEKRALGYEYVSPAIALVTIWIGYFISETLIWYHKDEISDILISIPSVIFLLGLIISLIGVLCTIRIFSPNRWGNWGWIVSLIMATCSMIVTFIL